VQCADEFAQPLAAALHQAEDDAFGWLRHHGGGRATADTAAATDVDTGSDQPDNVRGSARREAGAEPASVLDELYGFLEQHPDSAVEVSWRVVR
jgi:hypothetical protein